MDHRELSLVCAYVSELAETDLLQVAAEVVGRLADLTHAGGLKLSGYNAVFQLREQLKEALAGRC